MPALSVWDWFLLLAVGLSVAAGMVMGLSRTLAGLAAGMIALAGTPLLAPGLAAATGMLAREVLVWLIVFVTLLLIARLMGLALARRGKGKGPDAIDRMAGALWGMARAVILVIAAVGIAGMLGMHQAPGWRQALSRPVLDALLQAVEPHLPEPLSGSRRN